MKVLLGYFIRRAVRDVEAVKGKTFCAYGHQLFPTRERAQALLDLDRREHLLDSRYEYDVAEAWMDTGEGTAP